MVDWLDVLEREVEEIIKPVKIVIFEIINEKIQKEIRDKNSDGETDEST